MRKIIGFGVLLFFVQLLRGQVHEVVYDSTFLRYVSPKLVGIDSVKLYYRIDSIVQQAIDTGAFPGCQILFAKDGKVFYHQAFGYHTYQNDLQVRVEDIYDLASITKVMATTVGLMKLYEEGKFDLDKTMGDYFPFLKGSDKADLSIRKVLGHQSRLKSWIPYYKESQRKNGQYRWRTIKEDSSRNYPNRIPGSDLFLYKKYYSKKILKMIKKSPLNEKEEMLYSGLSFYLFPKLIEQLSGLSFEAYLSQNFYQPLGATTLGFNPTKKFSLDQIAPSEIDTFFRMKSLHGVVHDEGAAMMLGVSGNAGLFSNSLDLAKISQMLLNEGVYNGHRYLEASSVKEFNRCQYCEVGNRRGLGFDKPLIEYDFVKSSVAKEASPQSFGHSGYTGTFVWMDPANGLLYIFLSNRVYPTRNNGLLFQMNVRPGIHQVVYDLLK